MSAKPSIAWGVVALTLVVPACGDDAEAELVRKIRDANDPKLDELTDDLIVGAGKRVCSGLDDGFSYVEISNSEALAMEEAGGADYIPSHMFLLEQSVRTLCPRYERQIP
jgi:hypothetical protein